MNPFDPMPTIKAILGWPMQQDIAESIMLAQLDDFEPPQCESVYHATDASQHSGLAKFLMTVPCCTGGYVCADNASWLQTFEKLRCADCGQIAEITAFSFIPIAGTQ